MTQGTVIVEDDLVPVKSITLVPITTFPGILRFLIPLNHYPLLIGSKQKLERGANISDDVLHLFTLRLAYI